MDNVANTIRQRLSLRKPLGRSVELFRQFVELAKVCCFHNAWFL
jgi:hypothetical protein